MKRIFALILVLVLLLCACGQEAERIDVSKVLNETAEVLLERVPEPAPGAVGGDWTVIGMARWGGEVPDGWFDGYAAKLEEYVAACGGVLHEKKYTEYSRVILTVTALGGDARNVAGYDLTAPLEDIDQTVFQGVNGAIYALMALDSGDHGSDELRARYVDHILAEELPGGGWTFMGDAPETDLTAMALQALASYRDREDVAAAAERGLAALAELPLETSESISQTITALAALGVDAEDDRFVRDGKTLLGQLLEYRCEDGLFCHVLGAEGDLLATEQALLALCAAAGK